MHAFETVRRAKRRMHRNEKLLSFCLLARLQAAAALNRKAHADQMSEYERWEEKEKKTIQNNRTQSLN